MNSRPATLLVIVGATGDLARRMLFPALYGLERDGMLPAGLTILGAARSTLDRDGFRAEVAAMLAAQAPPDQAARERLLGRLEYHTVDLAERASLTAFAERVKALRQGVVLYHLSTAPNWYGPFCAALAAAGGIDPEVRLMLEKPLGHDLASAREINDAVGTAICEDQVFRVDHYLGKEGVQNLLALRFGNALFEPLWNARHIAQVQITVHETVGVEGRVEYYDASGALRDMVQNHLLQLLCLTAMEPPSEFEATAVRNEKIKVLRALRPLGAAELADEAVFGQYTAGAIDGAAVPGYSEELGRPSQTETYVALRVMIDNWRWSKVPFYLRSGKRLGRRVSEIYLQFHAVPHLIFPGARVQPNAMLIRLQPEERISLLLMSKTPGLDRDGLKLSEVKLDLDLHNAFADLRRRGAYERLYLDALEGNGTLFVRRDEVEAAWSFIDQILAARRALGEDPKPYSAGSWGPGDAAALPTRLGHRWRE